MILILAVLNLAYVLSLVCYIRIKCTHQYARALPWKMLTSLLFLAIALSFLLVLPQASHYGWLVMAGLLASLAGDYFLDRKYMDSRRHDRYTFLGFGAFIVAHVFFSAGIFSVPQLQLPPASLLVIGIMALAFAALVVATAKPFGLDLGRFRTMTFLYGFVLAGITLLAGVSMTQDGLPAPATTGLQVLFAGLVLFVLSDLVLSHTFFGENKHTSPYIVANYLLYYGAQLAIAWSVGVMSALR